MTKNSVLGQFFPDEFEIDISGKRKEWEGIVLLPKVNITAFLEAYNEAAARIDRRDSRRNIVGRSFRYRKSKECFPVRSYYGDIPDNVCKRTVVEI